jgi:hypothetical protein
LWLRVLCTIAFLLGTARSFAPLLLFWCHDLTVDRSTHGVVCGVWMRRRSEKQERAKDENFKDWRRRFGEATMQRLGLAQEIRDETTGDIEGLLTR